MNFSTKNSFTIIIGLTFNNEIRRNLNVRKAKRNKQSETATIMAII